MKKQVLKVLIIIAVFTHVVFLCSACGLLGTTLSENYSSQTVIFEGEHNMFNLFHDSGEDSASLIIEKLIDGLEGQDSESMEQLFAPIVEYNVSLEEQIEELFCFITSEVTGYQQLGSYSTTNKDHVIQQCYFMITLKITTVEDVYNMAIKLCTQDTVDSNNIGVHSLYVAKSSGVGDGTAYWGNHQWDYGIVIEIPDCG